MLSDRHVVGERVGLVVGMTVGMPLGFDDGMNDGIAAIRAIVSVALGCVDGDPVGLVVHPSLARSNLLLYGRLVWPIASKMQMS